MATETRPVFLPITGQVEVEAIEAALRFAAVVRDACGYGESHPSVTACSMLAARAFRGDMGAWPPLVTAVRQLLTEPAPPGNSTLRSRRELRAFVAENADLLEH